MPVIWNDHGHAHATAPHQHVHECVGEDCQAFYVCTQHDACDSQPYRCPACELDHIDDMMNAYERRQEAE